MHRVTCCDVMIGVACGKRACRLEERTKRRDCRRSTREMREPPREKNEEGCVEKRAKRGWARFLVFLAYTASPTPGPQARVLRGGAGGNWFAGPLYLSGSALWHSALSVFAV